MLPNKTEFQQVGVLPGEQVDMTFDENSLGHLASILINLYSDKELAVIREYSTNARDSHIRAGIERPIEITTPSYLSFFFKVKDYGIGLSKQDIVEIYSKYGASTKRGTNKENGMLGLGCKSALTYTDQFTISSVKDGVRINIVVSRAVDGGGSMTILSETQTIDSNGVEITVPVARNNNFAEKCQKFFQYWEEGTVLINGKPPRPPSLNKITDRVYLKDSSYYYGDKPILVMGGVSYEINQDQVRVPNNLVAFVDIGEVSFQPSREYLHYTPKTISTLESLKQEYKDNLIKKVQVEIDKQSSRLAAIKEFVQWRTKLRDVTLDPRDFTYLGEYLQESFQFDGRWKSNKSFDGFTYNYGILSMEHDIIVYGFEAEKLTSYQKQKLNLWSQQNGYTEPWFYFCQDVPGGKWLEDIKQVDWKEILALKISRASTTGQATNVPTYEMFTQGRSKMVKSLDTTKPILYSTKGDWKRITEQGEKTQGFFPDIQFVFIGENRKKKFLLAYPDAKPLKDGLKAMVESVISGLTDQQKMFLRSNEYELSRYARLDKTRLDDPDLTDIIESSKNRQSILMFQRNWENLCSMSWELGIKDMHSLYSANDRTRWVEERYPLVSTILSRTPYNAGQEYWDHVYIYLNSAYDVYKNKGV
jgi:hypothetical protein